MSEPRKSEFYWEPTYRCSIHTDKSAGYVVKRRGEVYRNACTERCASTQALELDEAWTGNVEPIDPSAE